MYNLLNLFYGNKGCNQEFEGDFFLNVLVGGGWGDVGGWWLRGLGIGGGLGDEMDAVRDQNKVWVLLCNDCQFRGWDILQVSEMLNHQLVSISC